MLPVSIVKSLSLYNLMELFSKTKITVRTLDLCHKFAYWCRKQASVLIFKKLLAFDGSSGNIDFAFWYTLYSNMFMISYIP